MFWFTNPVALVVWTILALVVVSSIVGGFLARRLRMVDYGWKFSVILFAILASSLVVYRGWPPKLGVDLAGGSILVYEVDPAFAQNVDMDKLVSSISERVNPGGQKEIRVRKLGADKVQITMPAIGQGESAEKQEADKEEIKRIIYTSGALEFRIVANTVDNQSLIERAMSEPNLDRLKDSNGELLAKWVPVAKDEASALRGDKRLATRVKGDRVEALVVMDHYNVTGDYLRQASVNHDEKGGLCVDFQFDSMGGSLFAGLTGDNVPTGGFDRHLAILLDEELRLPPPSAP